MKHIRRDLNSNRMIYRKYAKNYRHNMNILTFLKSNYKYKRRTTRCHTSSRQQRHQWSLPCRQHKQEQKHKHKLPANEEMLTNNKQIIKRNPFYENIKLDKFLRIFILIMQQATPTYNNKSNSYNNKTKNNNSKMITQLVAKMKTIKNTNKTPPNVNVNGDDKVDVEVDVEMKDGDEADINKNHYAYKDANKDTDINVDISNIPDEISHQQNNYDKVSTITSTPIKCQRRKHHQIKATKSSPSSSSTSSQISAKTTSIANVATRTTKTITTSTMDTLLSSPSIANYETCQWSTILRHYVSENSSLHQHQYHHNIKHIHTPHQHHYQHALHIQSLITSRVLNINSNNKCNKQTINCSRRGSTNTTQTAVNRETGMNNIYQSFDQYVNSTWNRSYTLSCLLLTLFIAFSIGVRSTTAGACWQTVLDNGKCNEIFSLNISKSECCGANQEFAYTEREPTNVEYFFATAIGGGMECSPCLESCRNVKCGPNKKCVKRKGRPKCVCAPECGAARRKRKQREHSPVQQEQKPQQQHHTLHLVDSHIKNGNNDDEDDEDGHGGDGYILDVAANIRSTNAFKIKIEKSQQQSRDTRSLSSEITNINLGLENGKDTLMKISSGEISPMERHHYKENNQNQRKTKHLHMHQWQFMQQQQQEEQQQQEPNHKNQEPKGSRRILITANVEHTEKPTTRRLQILSNVRTTNSRRHNSNKHNNNNNKNKKQNKSNKKEHGQHEDTDPLDYDDDDDENDEDDYNYNENTEADTKEPRKKNISNNNNNNNKHKNKNNRNDDSTRFLNQSLSRHKLKTNTKSNTNNRNRNTNKNQHDLHRTKLQQNSSNNNTRVRHSQQNGRHAENTPHHRHHNRNHHSHHQHQHRQQQLQQQQYEQHEQNQHNHNHQQQSQNHGRHKHKNGNKQLHNQQQHNNKQQQTIVLKIPKNNKDYNITTTNNIAIVNATATNSDKDAIATDVSSSTNLLQQSKFSKAATAINSLNLSIPSATPQHIQSQLLLLSSSSSPSSSSSSSSSAMSSLSSTTPVNSTMSADYDDDNDDGAGGNAAAASDDHYHSRIPNHGNKLATSSILSDTSSSSSSSSPSHSQFSVASASASTRSSSESSVVQMSAKGEGVSLLDDHKHRIEIPTKIVFNKNNNNNNNNDNIISTLHSNLHNTQQQQQQRDQQIQSQHNYQTPLFDGFSEQFDLIGFQNKKQQQQTITNGDSIRPLNPVCGTDGRTYNTECQLRKRACRTDNPNLQISYRGHCRTTCNGVQCLNGLTCVEDQNSMPHCIACKIECPQDDYDNDVVDATKAVCGADGKTYKSTCDINRMICKIGRSIGVAYPGPCREDQVTCDDINCGPKQVCLIDLLTHKPRCTSCRYKCSRKRRPSSLHFEEGKICGVNNHTYNSWCEMRKDSCSTGFYIDVKYSGACH